MELSLPKSLRLIRNMWWKLQIGKKTNPPSIEAETSRTSLIYRYSICDNYKIFLLTLKSLFLSKWLLQLLPSIVSTNCTKSNFTFALDRAVRSVRLEREPTYYHARFFFEGGERNRAWETEFKLQKMTCPSSQSSYRFAACMSYVASNEAFNHLQCRFLGD